MDEIIYFESESIRVILERASVVSETALSVFRFNDDIEVDKEAQCGSCSDACAYVSKHPWGKQACKLSREDAALAAIRRNKPVPFLCHMGFSGVAIRACAESKNYVIMFGPFYPNEVPESVDQDALDGLKALNRQETKSLPFALDDIPRINAQSLPVLAEWTRDTITAQLKLLKLSKESSTLELDTIIEKRHENYKSHSGTKDATALLAALRTNDLKRAGLIIESSLVQPGRKKLSSHDTSRARCLMLLSSVLEEAESGGIDTSLCWDRISKLTDTLYTKDEASSWRKSVLEALKPLRPKKQKKDEPQNDFRELDSLLNQNLADGITLQEIAKKLEQNPTTLTKRLQRNFGISYSDYVGRLRVDRAKHLFQSTNLTVTAVAQRVGLNDPSNFSKLFKKHAGKSPGAYRTQLQINGKR